MNLFRSRRASLSTPPEPPHPLDLVRGAAGALERARHQRDDAIRHAKAQRVPLREVADAAGLSVSRVKQFESYGRPDSAHLPPVTEVDLQIANAPSDRVLALDDVDPWIKRWDSERAFIADDPRRRSSARPDIHHNIYDVDPNERWVAVYVESTHEVYAFQHALRHHSDVLVSPSLDNVSMQDGSTSGPCVLLGHMPTYKLVDIALNDPAGILAHRPGGLAWLYGRIRLVNRLVAAISDPIGGFQNPESMWQYLRTIEGEQR